MLPSTTMGPQPFLCFPLFTVYFLPCAGRLESFFGPSKVVSSTMGPKRPAAAPAGKGPASKKGKAGGVGAGKGKKK